MCDCHNEVVAWAWVRPADPGVLEGRPLLDLGTGDGQTLVSLSSGAGLIVGLDRSLDALRAARNTGLQNLVSAQAEPLPFRAGTFATVLAGDLFHHLDDERLAAVLREARRVLGPGGTLVAWWYERTGRQGPGAPRFPRGLDAVAAVAERAAFTRAQSLDLVASIDPIAPTAGLLAEV